MTRILTLLYCGLVLASCSRVTGSEPLPVAPVTGAPNGHPGAGTGYHLLYSFVGGSNASYPVAGLTNLNGKLYGTAGGGGKSNQCGDAGCGTVFEISTSGSESVLYRFKGTPDGAVPLADMIVLNGVLYGTTSQGGSASTTCGAAGCGSVFDVDTSGKERVLYAFQGGAEDGAAPDANLAALNRKLYGTTVLGGPTSTECPKGCGTVFDVNRSGQEHVLHAFAGSPDGIRPKAGLLGLHGYLYGTTYGGGANNMGTVFEISGSGKEHVLYSFSGGLDGAYPSAGLVEAHGKLYGTTVAGGGKGACSCGTVFETSTSGAEHVVYRFKGGKDGESPYAPVVVLNHKLYGTTAAGGIYGAGCGGGFRCGTVFEVSESGTERVLHRFSGFPDGAFPYAGLVDVSGTLYGTTSQGGSSASGCCGTVFELSP